MWEPRRLTNLWASTACYKDSFTFTFLATISLTSKASPDIDLTLKSDREIWGFTKNTVFYRRVVWTDAGVSEENVASIFNVEN
jgi:hypothetical protein